ncbi:hypothetical protein GCM10023189_50160 [Nibrella saemangeumensis]|uniref:Signal transduction histidine kinase internal region domain-containing protein n=1 Tax=Nibrella saemangeumensis TaxID=1084526 RepID=A0ABP8NHJ3_9BACT
MIYNVYFGAASTIILLNLVQWSLSRDRIYGIFTFQSLLWFTHAVLMGIITSDNQSLAALTTINGLVIICYLELVYRLFSPLNDKMHRRYRWIQAGILVYVVIEGVLTLTAADPWQTSPAHRLFSLLYWGTLTGCCLLGIKPAAQRRDAVGRFFVVGSILLMVNEARVLGYYVSSLLSIEWYATVLNQEYVGQILAGGFIVKLLCFSLCLVFRQRQLAVAQAVRQTRTEEQLVQERLQAELTQRRLEQEKAEVQLRALQSQVNPHFLFNALNSLSSLISEEPAQAEEFVDKLSDVYRYVLRANEQSLTTVAAELQFIDAYFHLLKTRYGQGIHLTIDVDPVYNDCQIPPLTLQLLVENAVKHNVVSAKRPLSIRITTSEAGELTISNTLQKKQSRVFSNGVGLTNIVVKYQMLNLPAPAVAETDDTFTVVLPMVAYAHQPD